MLAMKCDCCPIRIPCLTVMPLSGRYVNLRTDAHRDSPLAQLYLRIPHGARLALCAFLPRASSFSKSSKLCLPSPLRPRNATLMFSNLFDDLRAFANGALGTATDVCTHFFGAKPTASISAAMIEERGDSQPKPGANDMPLQPNDAAAQPPSCDLLPSNPYTRSSPPSTSKQSRTVIDLSSPPKSVKRMRSPEEPPAAARPPSSRSRPSADEKRLVGDYRYGDTQGTGNQRKRS
jgi:hypothetical protein